MGYNMSQEGGRFTIKAANKTKAFRAIKALTGMYAWVDEGPYATLKAACEAWRWELHENADTGDIDGISFTGEKLGDDEVLFNALAPYVERGSYIEMSGEEAALWRWTFNGKEMKEVYAEVSWGDQDD